MNRFLLINSILPDGLAKIDDLDQLHHIRDVLRLKPREKVELFDGKGNEYPAMIELVEENFVKLKVGKCLRASGEFAWLTVACAIPKNVRMDDIVDKLTQLGVGRIIPLNSQRVVVKLDKQKMFLRRKRWEKIALSATKQSQRNYLPIVDEVKSLSEVLKEADKFDLKLIPTLCNQTQGLKKIFDKLNFKPKNILVAIGPEGDFTGEEVEMAKGCGFIPVSLGRGVLRVDTAAVAVASFILFNEDH